MVIEYTAHGVVREIVEALGRTEDIRFSPDNRRLAIAGFSVNRIAVLDVEIDAGTVALTGGFEFASSALNCPHGLDFIDDGMLVVTSRKGCVAMFELPPRSTARRFHELPPVKIRGESSSPLASPGSVAVIPGEGKRELLICSNAGHCVTRHRIGPGSTPALTGEGPLLQRWLNLPDGICVSHDRQWIAISNHNTHNVLLYRWSERLTAESKPDGVLRGLYFPHGLRFTADGQHLLVADAGAPLIQVYAGSKEGWHGARYPVRSVRAMDEAIYRRGRGDPQEGGPKGIDIDRGMNVLVATCEHQPLLFLDLPAVLKDLPTAAPIQDVEYEFGVLEQGERLRLKVLDAETRAAKAEHRLRKRRAKWLPEPLRRLYFAWRPTH